MANYRPDVTGDVKALNRFDATLGVRGFSGYVTATINGKVYVVASIQKIQTTIDTSISEVKAIGRRMAGHKEGVMSGKFTATLFYGTPEFKNMITKYKDSGTSPRFNFKVANTEFGDESGVGAQAITYKNCLFDSMVLSNLDAETEILTEDVSGTFDDYVFDTFTASNKKTYNKTFRQNTKTMYKYRNK